MTVPLATTTIGVRRPQSGGDPYETAATTTQATGVRAHISAPTGRERIIGGQLERVDATLLCDPTDLTHYDLIDDEETGETWRVEWVRRRRGFGLDHMQAGLTAVDGGSSG